MASENQTVGTEIRPGGFVGPFLGPNCLQSFQQTLVYGWNNKFSLIQYSLDGPHTGWIFKIIT